jgi:hypothetical protein
LTFVPYVVLQLQKVIFDSNWLCIFLVFFFMLPLRRKLNQRFVILMHVYTMFRH